METLRRLDLVHQALDLLALRDIATVGPRSPVAVLDLSRDPGDLVFGAGANRYRGTCVTQRQGDGPAYTPARTGDKGDLSVETNRWS